MRIPLAPTPTSLTLENAKQKWLPTALNDGTPTFIRGLSGKSKINPIQTTGGVPYRILCQKRWLHPSFHTSGCQSTLWTRTTRNEPQSVSAWLLAFGFYHKGLLHTWYHQYLCKMGFSRNSSAALEKSEKSWSIKRLVTRLKKKTNSNLDDLMIIGIDFGTTYVYFLWSSHWRIYQALLIKI